MFVEQLMDVDVQRLDRGDCSEFWAEAQVSDHLTSLTSK